MQCCGQDNGSHVATFEKASIQTNMSLENKFPKHRSLDGGILILQQQRL